MSSRCRYEDLPPALRAQVDKATWKTPPPWSRPELGARRGNAQPNASTGSGHDLKWFEEYAGLAELLKPLTTEEWRQLAALLHEINSPRDANATSDATAGQPWVQNEGQAARERTP